VAGCYGSSCCVQDGAFHDKLRDSLSGITVMDFRRICLKPGMNKSQAPGHPGLKFL
jgi:hypothetical protein